MASASFLGLPVVAVRRFQAAREKLRQDLEPKLAPFFDWMHSDLKKGPLSMVPIAFLGAIIVAVVTTAGAAVASYEDMPNMPEGFWWLQPARAASFLFGAAVSGCTIRAMGVWPMLSWTLSGWNVCTLRYLMGALNFQTAQRVLTFPSMMANTVTVLVWYSAVVPGVLILAARGSKEKRAELLNQLVWSPYFFLVHGFNLPWALGDWYVQPVRLSGFDLWVG